MVAKKNGHRRKPVVTSENVAQVWRTYPKLTLASLAAIIAILTSIAPFAISWYNDFVRHAEFNQYKVEALRSDLWRDVRAFGMEAIVARNRVNDCNLMRERKNQVLSQLERNVCKQYEEDLAEANRRVIEARNAAMALAKDKQ